MLILKIAWRSFVRHRRHSAISSLAIAFGLALSLLFFSLNEYSHRNLVELGVKAGSGHVVVQGNGYQEDQTLNYIVADPAAVAEQAQHMPEVRDLVFRAHANGLLSSGADSMAVMLSGVEPHKEPHIAMAADPDRLVAGAYLRTRAELPFENQPADIYIGVKLAENLSLAVGDRVVLTVAPRDDERPTRMAFLVRGIFRTGMTDMDSFYAEISLGEAQRFFGIGGGVTQVALFLHDQSDSGAVAAHLRASLDESVEVLPWQVALRELYEGIQIDNWGTIIISGIILIIVGIGIFNTVLMSVIERTHEFGVIAALGTSRAQLVLIIMAEAALLALIATSIGLAVGIGAHWYIAEHGISIAALNDYEFSGVLWEGKIYSVLGTGIVVKLSLAVITLVLLAALYPAWHVSRLKPVEAMRHV